MKSHLVSFLKQLAKNDVFWFLIKPLVSAARVIYNSREDTPSAKRPKNLDHPSIFSSLTVLNGPFKGMKYPNMTSKGSTLYPKLLGSYESELHGILHEFKQIKYSQILDIGCAEGYFAVGMALQFQCDKLYAYDLDKTAIEACKEMAKLNGVASKIETNLGIDAVALASFRFTGKSLILCDCEGFEKELFSKENIQNLAQCDLIIETHDLFDIEISTYLIHLFSKTHTVETILSTDDIIKALDSSHIELANMSLGQKKNILAEERPAIMKWLICRPK
ncbi:50S ribosomal protein L11 methyltransferase [Bacteroidia bacterium]|nr:50S ribosomal protein L11 methyltransferase [Bacteroidia bacterium]